MKTKLILLMMVFAAVNLSAQNKLTIVIDGIEKIKGHMLIGLYDQESFMKKPLFAKIEAIENDVVTVEFEDISSGKYAVSVYQDENDNKKLDTGTYGIPVEKYGFSNNAKGEMGPPKFDDCEFEMNEDTVIYITL